MDGIKAPEPQVHAGPGLRLRAAREAIKLSTEQVAHHLRLERKVIQELEADRYENMPRFTFVRGYLRSYARLVDLPADEVVLAFDGLSLAEKPIERIDHPYEIKEYTTLKNLFNKSWLPYMLFVAVLLFGAMAYQSVTHQNIVTVVKGMMHR